MSKVKPICPVCTAVGNMAGSMEGPIFCATCGARFENGQALWDAMNLLKFDSNGNLVGTTLAARLAEALGETETTGEE